MWNRWLIECLDRLRGITWHRLVFLRAAPTLKAPTKRTERNDEDTEKQDGNDHRDHSGHILARSADHEPCCGQGQNESD